jgi:hypothetical protein
MNKYDIYIEDIFDRSKTKQVSILSTNVYLAHKEGLKSTNAIREEISKIIKSGNVVFTFKNGFSEE